MRREPDRRPPLPTLVGMVAVAWLSFTPCEAQFMIRVSLASDGTEGNASSHYPAVSSECRYVAFRSNASNLVADDTNEAADIFVHTVSTGVTFRVSLADNGMQANDVALYRPAISGSGRLVAFTSRADNLVPGDVNGLPDVFVRDWRDGRTTLVSVTSDGSQLNGLSTRATISTDGRYVAFVTDATNLNPSEINFYHDVYIHDRQTRETWRVTEASDGTGANAVSWEPCISPEGRYAGFTSNATNLISGDTNSHADVFVRDSWNGEIDRISVATGGTQSNDNSGGCAISQSGRYVVFGSLATNLVPDDTNGVADAFVHNRQTGETTRVHVTSDGAQADDKILGGLGISADGSTVVFTSLASNLVSDDTNLTEDVFVHRLMTGQTTRVSVATDGTEGNASSSFSTLSPDRCGVVFRSDADTMVPNDHNEVEDIFLRTLDLLFSDGFESGNTSGWTAQQPPP